MSTTSSQEEPVTYENVLRLIKHQTIEFEKRLAASIAVWEEERRQQAEERAERAAEQAKRDAEFIKWQRESRQQEKQLRSEIGGIGRSNGEYAEQFFIRAMKRSKTFGGLEYNQVSSNWNAHNNRFDEEYDIILHNGDSLVLIEVKYKFAMSDFTKFTGRKVAHFREFYTAYADKKLYLGIAGFSFEDGVIEAAKGQGIGILHKDGKNVEFDTENLKEF